MPSGFALFARGLSIAEWLCHPVHSLYRIVHLLFGGKLNVGLAGDPYGGLLQSRDLRTISSAIQPRYTAKNDTFEFNADFNLTSDLTLTSQTGVQQ